MKEREGDGGGRVRSEKGKGKEERDGDGGERVRNGKGGREVEEGRSNRKENVRGEKLGEK